MEKDEVRNRINELCDQVEALLSEREIKGYKLSPLFKQILDLYNEHLGEDEENLPYDYGVFAYVGYGYQMIGRPYLAAQYYFRALGIAKQFYYQSQGNIIDGLDNVLEDLLQCRNVYEDDDCPDVFELLSEVRLIREEDIERIRSRAFARRRGFISDPVEKTQEYLDAIDAVEEEIDAKRKIHGKGSAHEYWQLKADALALRGVYWRCPAELNPRIHFD